MSTQQHSPTPWEASAHQDDYGDVVYITSPPGTHPMPIAVCRGPKCKENGLRLQQCVNACAELPEPGKVAGLIGEMKRRLNDDETLPMQRFVAQQVLDVLGVSS